MAYPQEPITIDMTSGVKPVITRLMVKGAFEVPVDIVHMEGQYARDSLELFAIEYAHDHLYNIDFSDLMEMADLQVIDRP